MTEASVLVRSTARQRLSALLDDQAQHAARLAELSTANGRLADIQSSEDAARSALANFDASRAGELAAWAQGKGPAPDAGAGAKRENLQRIFADAAAQSVAARQAAEVIVVEMQRENNAVAALAPQINATIAEILADEIDPMLVQLKLRAVELLRHRDRVMAGVSAVRQLAESGPADLMQPAFARLERLNGEVDKAVAAPAPQDEAARESIANWASFAAALRVDSNANVDAAVAAGIGG
jgi:hypothetical protein